MLYVEWKLIILINDGLQMWISSTYERYISSNKAILRCKLLNLINLQILSGLNILFIFSNHITAILYATLNSHAMHIYSPIICKFIALTTDKLSSYHKLNISHLNFNSRAYQYRINCIKIKFLVQKYLVLSITNMQIVKF